VLGWLAATGADDVMSAIAHRGSAGTVSTASPPEALPEEQQASEERPQADRVIPRET
jgi:hypothetical protein